MKFVKLKNIVSRKITDGPHVSPDYVDIGVPFISGSEISGGKVVLRDGTKMISEMLHNVFYKRTPTRKNDILLVKNGSIGNCAFVDTDLKFSIWVPLALIRVKDSYNPKYVYYTIISEKTQTYLRENASETAQPNLSISTINNILVQNIDINSQNKIALFLDENCYKIDNEVALLQKKSILLDEYKNALIYETVTKGLDKNAEMKDSGIEWMGCVPIHWNIRRVKNILTNLNKSSFASGDADDGEYNFYVSGKKIKKISKFNLDKTAILLPTGGTFITHFNDNERCSYSTDVLALLLKNKNCNLKFYYYLFSSSESFFNEDLFYGSGLKHLNRKGLFSTIVPVPLLKEQNNIVNYLDIETKKIEKQIELINKKVELLKEYKQSLIYEAVTGQLEIE